ncbi:ADP-ribose pyrophosphatase [Tamilnaduibacter salinus]|uniref:ADP-ribose pyrophosphatase n=1 Tax=Tamilnaduibacter salinus TaxID=1484056 RepID=A0A2U1CU78_9GAMM|nr:NUDIX domain-containing protein [Tamilnaduibacter salinus]PVY70356.1 ADP-ribose pyrophosphatase [Tamilnaduibacter salinus]
MPKSPTAPFQFTSDDVRIESQETVFEGFFRMGRLRLSHARFAGGYTETIQRELFLRGDATCVLPYDPARDEVVLLEQFRPGALWRDQSPWLLELVAGMDEPGESAEEVAHREGEEEAGLRFARLEPICRYLVSPGGTTEMVRLFCGLISSEGAGGLYGLEAENEDIRAHVLSLAEALAMLDDGRINNAAAIIALQWLSIHRERLREAWQ